ncbi:cornifin-B-like isoform X2 [Pteronotus mesoamericanus]|uniref:cornifin-B-like n=1 Tax=Pteronotus mesoamericanus TaxID=1884717 RepID=UPI0023EB3B46|nr:cornifin-B-like [Pteronotus parnellii mesoamericanus]XP_054418895.1 cornifin-B-like isoform X2 [Pteronotus parnellii mesoamericanus]
MSSYQQKQQHTLPPQLEQQQVKQPQLPPPQETFVPITKEPCQTKDPGHTKVPQPGHTKVPEPVHPQVPQHDRPMIPEPLPPVVIPDLSQQKTKQK